MSIRRKNDTITNLDERLNPSEAISDTELEICSCPPISSLCLHSTIEHTSASHEWDDDEEHSQILPTPPALNALLRTRLQTLSPPASSLSVMLLHVSQLEHIHITPTTDFVHKRKRFHPTADMLEQVLANVRRAIRVEDSIYLDAGKGAAIIFPNVDQEGAYTILERVFNSVNLLQAETITPPLSHETDVVLGIGSYPEQGPSLEHVLASAGRVMHRLTLRPAITMNLWDAMPVGETSISLHDTFDYMTEEDEYIQPQNVPSPLVKENTPGSTHSLQDPTTPVPFLQLPKTLPTRLKSLLAYRMAQEFRCVPMGRDHNRLTVAMANPTDTYAVHSLHEITGMSIFPVACDTDALDMLLAEQW